MNIKTLVLVSAVIAGSVSIANAQLRVTEVAPWSSGQSPVGADWFEVTNFGPTSFTVAGLKFDDNSNSAPLAATLQGVSTIAPGESVIFIEGIAQTATNFIAQWYGNNPPATLQVGFYSGTGLGLSTGGDAVNLYDASDTLLANVTFGASDSASPFRTFDNSAGLNNAPITTFSEVGVNGAFSVIQTTGTTEIGSPGVPIPEPAALGLIAAGTVVALRRRRQV